MGEKMKRLLAVIVSFIFLTGNITSQDKPNFYPSSKFTQNQIESLIVGAKSNNFGLRKSAIFLIGQYRVKDACSELLIQFEECNDEMLKILIAQSIYKIGCPLTIEQFKGLAEIEDSFKVKNFCAILYENYMFAKG